MHWLGCSLGLALCYCTIIGVESFTWLKRSQNEAKDEYDLEDWQKLLFPDGNNPLDKLIESSSASEEEEEQPVGVYQTKFPARQLNDNDKLEQDRPINRVNRETAEFFANELASMVKSDWQGRTIENFELKILQLNLTISSVKIVHIEFPVIRFERPTSDTLQLIGSGGMAFIRGNYRSKFRTTRRGQFEVYVNGLNIDLNLRFQRSRSGHLSILEMECKPVIARLSIKMTPFLLDEVQKAVEKRLWLLFQREICARAEDYVRRTDEKFQEAGQKTPFDTKVDNL